MADATFCFVLDSPPRLVSAGDDIESLLGFRPGDFLAEIIRLKERIHPGDADVAELLFSPETLTTSGSVNLRIRHADGRIRCFKARYVKECPENGPLRLEIFLEDARTVSEPGDTTLIASFKSLIEHTRDYIFLKNCNHVILAAGRSLPNFTEAAKEAAELVGKTDYDLHPEEIADIGYRLERQAMAEGKRVNESHQIKMQDGSRRWIDNRKYPINGPGGEIIGVLGIAPEITEHIEAAERLRESEESLQQAQKIAGSGSYVLEISSGLWTSSKTLDEIFGIDCAYERTFGGWRDLIHPDHQTAISDYFRETVLGQGKPFDREYRIVRRSDGVERWVHGRGKLVFDAYGQSARMHGTVEDITERKKAEAALLESRELLQVFIKHAPVSLAMFDREMHFVAVSRRWLEAFALVESEIIGRHHYEIFPDLPERWREAHRRGLAGESVCADDDRYDRGDGKVQWGRWQVVPWRTADGVVGGIIVFAEDITERKQAEERLRLAATVFTGAREGIFITDPAGTILEVNDSFTRITGYAREEALGQNARMLQSGMQSNEFYRNMWRSLAREGNWSGELWNRTKGGDLYPETLNIHAIRDADGQTRQYVGLFTDISEAKQHEQELVLAANYDALTGLPNRALFADRLRQAMGQAHRHHQLLAVVCFDLDGFKTINDAYGHSGGDALLTALALRMKRALHEGDTLARLGGDEFAAVILDLPDSDSCLSPLTRMLAAAAEEVVIGDVPLRVTASAGVAFYPQTEEVDADVLLRQAGQALYEAKVAGKDRYSIFDPDQDLTTRSRHENLARLRRALAAEEFVLYYQPKVNMRTGEVIGAEALLRWQHPERGLLTPGFFLPAIENDLLIVDVGQWVIENALNQMEAWQDAGFEIPVSVNVSAIELQRSDFVSNLCARLEAHPRIKPSNLELEVVETSALQNVAFSSQLLTACREAGVHISVDDFGTGYSSLAYLKRLPVNVLKIDQTFVRDMLDEPDNLTILKGVLGLAEAFRLQVIAEGVETMDHGLMLLELGCDCAQGYGIARPMPARDLQPWAAQWRADPRWIEVPLVQANNRAALFAMVEHRAWYGHFIAHLQGTRPALPLLDPGQCSISAWLDAQRLAAGSLSPSIEAIETLHQQLHALAAEIHSAHVSGRKQDGLGLLRQLRYLHERCLKRLQPFTRISTRSSTRKSVASMVPQHESAPLGNGVA